MFRKKKIIVAITTFHTEFLQVSVPRLACIKSPIHIIIHNDNPDKKLSRRAIRKLGWRGSLTVINNKTNQGAFWARLNILHKIKKMRFLNAEWMIFLDDDQLLISADIPSASGHHYAIMQNKAVVKNRLLDLLRVSLQPETIEVDGINVVKESPNIGIVGTFLRVPLAVSLGALVEKIVPQVKDIDKSLGARPPQDIVMWLYFQIYAKWKDDGATALFFDRVNFVTQTLDCKSPKYGPNEESYQDTMNRYCNVFIDLLNSNSYGTKKTK